MLGGYAPRGKAWSEPTTARRTTLFIATATDALDSLSMVETRLYLLLGDNSNIWQVFSEPTSCYSIRLVLPLLL